MGTTKRDISKGKRFEIKDIDENIINKILDKINQKGASSLSKVEKKYLDSTGKGYVIGKTEEQLKRSWEKEKELKDQIDSEGITSSKMLEEVSQDTIDDYLRSQIKDIENGRDDKRTISNEELKLGSRSVINDYVSTLANKGKVAPLEIVQIVDQTTIDKVVSILLEVKSSPVYMLFDIIGKASGHIQEEFIKKAAEEGTYVEPKILYNASEEIRDFYLKKMIKKKGKDVIHKFYNHK